MHLKLLTNFICLKFMPNTTSFELSKQLDKVARQKGYELPKSSYIWEASSRFHNQLWLKTVLDFYIEIDDKSGMPDCGDVSGRPDIISREDLYNDSDGDFYPSYTTDELLAWLPPFTHVWKWIDGNFLADNKNIITEQTNIFSDTPSNALCKLAIYLLENDLMPKI